MPEDACSIPLNQIHYLMGDEAERVTKIATKEDWERFKRERAARKKGASNGVGSR